MAHSFDGVAGRAEDGEVDKLVNELIREIGAAEVPTAIRELAIKLQSLIDQRTTETALKPNR
ncbi:hypothetical protein [Rhizobium sp. C1]|uniref:hypothetical protein n=1 Tax=Rhizobium sp. C1 TaxID=1349799 RepID=UPI001E3C5A04|nr:hypothetical protein [Rhizobium sp. C1]MCD2178123.1 hypothetical protein [Rhizobium sp. C1]